MDIRNKLYPYPVLWAGNDDYIKSEFSCDIKILREGKNFLLEVNFNLLNEKIAELITKGKAEYVVRIECSATCYRRIMKSDKDFLKIYINESHLLGRTVINSYIVVKEKLENYYNDDFNADYNNVSFDLDIGNLLAIGNKYSIKVEKDVDELINMPSIFTICRRETIENIGLEPDIYSDKIRIYMNITDYENYSSFKNSTIQDAINLYVLLPTLVYVFDELRYAGIESFENYRWFISLQNVLKRYSMVLNQDLLETKKPMYLAQMIMEMPFSGALNSIKNLINEEEE